MTAKSNAEDGRAWLAYAEQDLAGARALLASPQMVPRHVCWLAQQAAEKAIKAALIFWRIDFPKTHDLDRLHDLMPDTSRTRAEFTDLAALTQYAVAARYPGDAPIIPPPRAAEAVSVAERLLASVRGDLVRSGHILL